MSFEYNANEIRQKCHDKTTLNEAQTEKIIEQVEELSHNAKDEGCDIFIDCPTDDRDIAVNVFSYFGSGDVYDQDFRNGKSGEVVARRQDEPAVFRTLDYGVETVGFMGRTYTHMADNRVSQRVTPIRFGEKTIGALIYEMLPEPTPQESVCSFTSLYCQVDLKKYPYMEHLRPLAECVDDSVIVLDSDRTIIYRNRAAKMTYDALGYSRDILGNRYESVAVNGGLSVAPGYERAFHTEELPFARKFFLLKEYCYFDESSGEYYYIVVIHDKTQLKQDENRIALGVITNKEAHHRIKNNLQNIYSLLDMQRRRSNEEAAATLQVAMNRILSMSEAYRTSLSAPMGLGDQENTDKVNLLAVLQMQRDDFLRMVEESGKQITVRIEGSGVLVSSYQASNLALVINELLQNSYKHAFSDRTQGNVTIRLNELPLYSQIVYMDDGEGFDAESAYRSGDSLGLQIIQNIVKFQLKGRLDVSSGMQGSVVTFDFLVS